MTARPDHSRVHSAVSFSPNNWSSTVAATTEPPFEEPQASLIFRAVFFSLTTLASLVGNSIMLKAAREGPSRKPLSYLLVTNLAVAELLSTVFLPFNFVFTYLGYWPFGQFACTFTMPIQVVSLMVVTSTLAAIAAYRFAVFQFKISIRSSPRVLLSLALLWLVSLLLTMPLFLFNKTILHDGKVYCDFTRFLEYEIARLTFNFGLPYLIMVLSYAAVAFKLKRHIRRRNQETTEMNELGQASRQSEDDPTASSTEEERRKSSRVTDLENDLLKMFYAVILIFAVCYFPYQVQYLFYISGGYDRYPKVGRYRDIIGGYSLLLTSVPSALAPCVHVTAQ